MILFLLGCEFSIENSLANANNWATRMSYSDPVYITCTKHPKTIAYNICTVRTNEMIEPVQIFCGTLESEGCFLADKEIECEFIQNK